VEQPAFDPGTASVTFRIGLQDYPTVVLLPGLLAALEHGAPEAALQVTAFDNREAAVDLLDAGLIDVAIGAAPANIDGRILTRPLLRDDFVTIVSRDRIAEGATLDLDRWLKMKHILVSPEGQRHGIVDQVLAQQGLHRKLGLTMPQVFAVPPVVARTGMTATILKRVALQAVVREQLRLFAPPVALPEMVFHLVWHRRSDTHPAQQWFRALLEQQAAAV
jgi:DNA-binding transcriptional LysR family regulator